MKNPTPIPYCSHNGFFSEMYGNIRHKEKRIKTKDQMLYTGHLNFLRLTGCNKDAYNLNKITEMFRDKAKAHYCLPDNIFDFFEGIKEMDFDPFSLPQDMMTISFNTKAQNFLIMIMRERNKTLVFPMNKRKIISEYRKLPEEENRKELIKTIKERSSLENEFASSMVTWVACTFCMEFGENGLTIREWLPQRMRHEENEIQKNNKTKAITSVLAHLGMWSEMFARPPEEVQFDYDPDWVPTKISSKNRKKGKIQEQKPIKVRLYLPKQKRISVDSDESEERGSQMQHMRSGHWRHYKNGRKIWIHSYVAGDAEKGTTINTPKTIEVFPRRM